MIVIQYNAENRPIRWQSGDTVITMSFDRMGRRVEMRTHSANSDLLQRFVYDNYLCIQQLRGVENALFHSYVWDPTEPIATRPLILLPSSGALAYYFHDGNKNVSDLIPNPEPPIHYAYTPFGTPTTSAPSENPFCFSSEMYDSVISYTYYNYRHYDSWNGRFIQRDLVGEFGGKNIFAFLENNVVNLFDSNGLVKIGNPKGSPPRGLPSDITCEDLYNFIVELADHVRDRRDAILNDDNRLYNNLNAKPWSKGGRGTWQGHQDAMKETQDRLNKALQYFSDYCDDFNQCLPQSVYDAAQLPLPTKPNWAQDENTPSRNGGNIMAGVAVAGVAVGATAAGIAIAAGASVTAPVWAPAALVIGLFIIY